MPNDLETPQELNRSYVRSAETSDVGWYDRHLAEDFLSTNPDGSLVDRATFLARMARPYPGKDLQARRAVALRRRALHPLLRATP